MATAVETRAIETKQIESIGVVAGLVWCYLDDNGPVTLSRLARELDVPRDLAMQGVGWLAREGKVAFQEGPRNKLLVLT